MNMQNNDKLLDMASKKLGIDREELKKSAGENGEKILGKLSQSDKDKVSAVLSDPEKTREILSSKKAQEMLKKFFGEK